MKAPTFLHSIRVKLFLVSLVLCLIPVVGVRFVLEMDRYLSSGQQQVLTGAARLLSAMLSDRPAFITARADTSLIEADSVNAKEQQEQRRLIALFASNDPETAASLGDNYLPSDEIEKRLSLVARDNSRIWVVDTRSQVRGLAGKLNTSATYNAGGSLLQRGYALISRPLRRLVTGDDGAVLEDAHSVIQSIMSQAERALLGQPTRQLRYAGRTLVLSAAEPIWLGDDIIGAVVIEESDIGTQSITYAAFETLLAMSLIVFLVGFVALLTFAGRLTYRVRRLQHEADLAIDKQGRIQGSITGVADRDEIGSLAQTLETILGRLKKYNDYLERLAARLSHELRTPVAVVRSSLDNLRHADLPAEQQVYISRADEGVHRLSLLISRMSEATQLEQFLHGAELETFDLSAVIKGCVEGYRQAFPNQVFELRLPPNPARMIGVPDAIAQLLDKLVQNSVDFAFANTPILVTVAIDADHAQLTVENSGPPLPAHSQGNLFGSMVSAREGHESGLHLGLGLYIVRLIAEFHQATLNAIDIPGENKVRFSVRFPLTMSACLHSKAKAETQMNTDNRG
ncbi:MAG: hypothetical protein JNM52_09665 [Betaproteobacteria bacterium]|nr:hypothetical protein [Betaproteobacteria bacterium]